MKDNASIVIGNFQFSDVNLDFNSKYPVILCLTINQLKSQKLSIIDIVFNFEILELVILPNVSRSRIFIDIEERYNIKQFLYNTSKKNNQVI